MNFSDNFVWQLEVETEISKLLNNIVLPKYFKKSNNFRIEIITASYDKDTKEATDKIAKVGEISIALRCRIYNKFFHDNPTFRDLTIRALINGHEITELKKIREGFAKLYLYCYIDKRNICGEQIVEYFVVDLDNLRRFRLDLLEFNINKQKRNLQDNNTFFQIISFSELKTANALIINNTLNNGKKKFKLDKYW